MRNKIKEIIQLGMIPGTLLLNTQESLAGSLESITSVSQLKKLQTTNSKYQTWQYLNRDDHCATRFINNQNNHPFITINVLSNPSFRNCGQQLESRFKTNVSSNEIIPSLTAFDMQNLASELDQTKNKLDQIKNNLIKLESQQFSTTTKLEGQVLFFIADSFGADDNSQTFSGYRTRLDFKTSFSGQDLLNVRLESRDIGRLDDVTDTLLSRLSVDGSSDDRVELAELSYSFNPGDSTAVVLGLKGVGLNDVGEVLNPFSSSSKGAVSRFGRRDPATLRGSGGAGIGIKQQFGDKISASAGYLSETQSIANPQAGGGLFDSSASAIAQLIVEPEPELALALTYTHIYQNGDDVNLMGSTGIEESNQPFGDNATTSDNFGLQVNWEINSSLEIGAWFSYTKAQQQENGSDRATILNGALTFAFPDLLAEGNQGGIIIGVPPTISEHDDSSLITESTPIHVEALYRLTISDQIQITPGAFAVFNPDNDDGNSIWVTTVRTLFSF